MKDITILIIEDEQKISTIMKSYFEKEDYEVLQAFDGKEGLRLFNKNKIKIIFYLKCTWHFIVFMLLYTKILEDVLPINNIILGDI